MPRMYVFLATLQIGNHFGHALVTSLRRLGGHRLDATGQEFGGVGGLGIAAFSRFDQGKELVAPSLGNDGCGGASGTRVAAHRGLE